MEQQHEEFYMCDVFVFAIYEDWNIKKIKPKKLVKLKAGKNQFHEIFLFEYFFYEKLKCVQQEHEEF